MTLILHIGSEKTGTTYIQSFLNKNYDLLKSYNIIYLNRDTHPAFFSKPFDSHKNHNQFSFVKSNLQSLRCFLNGQKTKYSESDFIISSEYFSSRIRSHRDLTVAKQFFEDIFEHVIIIGYFRPIESLINSSILELIKSGDLSFFNYHQLHTFEGFMNVLAFSNLFQSWTFCFKEAKFIYYEKILNANAPLYEPLLIPLLDASSLSSFMLNSIDIPPTNISIGKLQAQFMLLINSIFFLFLIPPSSFKHYISRFVYRCCLLLPRGDNSYVFKFSPNYYAFLYDLASKKRFIE